MRENEYMVRHRIHIPCPFGLNKNMIIICTTMPFSISFFFLSLNFSSFLFMSGWLAVCLHLCPSLSVILCLKGNRKFYALHIISCYFFLLSHEYFWVCFVQNLIKRKSIFNIFIENHVPHFEAHGWSWNSINICTDGTLINLKLIHISMSIDITGYQLNMLILKLCQYVNGEKSVVKLLIKY